MNVKTTVDGLAITCSWENKHFGFLLGEFDNLNSLKIIWLTKDLFLSSDFTNISNGLNNQVNKYLKQKNDILDVQFSATTDQYGSNLGEITAVVTADKSYPNGYPKEFFGQCAKIVTVENIGIQTFYSFRPKFYKVLKFEGSTLLAQTNYINSQFDTGLEDCDFYNQILTYCALRYLFAGLSNNSCFSLKWLYSNNYNKFLRNLENSEFSPAVVIFTEPQPQATPPVDFTNFNKYFKACDHK